MEGRTMISPKEVAAAATRKERENIKFRTFLKNRADDDELDRQFLRLHNEIFPQYNCALCRNCCKLTNGCFTDDSIPAAAAHLGMSAETFKAAYLAAPNCGEYPAKHTPCDFLTENGDCKLGDCKPDGCKGFPYTDRPNRLSSLYSVLFAVSVCPAAYEIWEALKKEYGFRSYDR